MIYKGMFTDNLDSDSPLITENDITSIAKSSSNNFKVGDYVKYSDNEKIIYGLVQKCNLVNGIQCLNIVNINHTFSQNQQEVYLKEKFAVKIKDIKDETIFIDNFIIQPSSIIKVVTDVDEEWKVNQEVKLVNGKYNACYKGKILWTGEINTIKAAAVKLENYDEKISKVINKGHFYGIELLKNDSVDVAFFIRSSLRKFGTLIRSGSSKQISKPSTQEANNEDFKLKLRKSHSDDSKNKKKFDQNEQMKIEILSTASDSIVETKPSILEDSNAQISQSTTQKTNIGDFKIKLESHNDVSKIKDHINDKCEQKEQMKIEILPSLSDSMVETKPCSLQESKDETNSIAWNCIFCTYKNSALSDVCQLCCKPKFQDCVNEVYITKINSFRNGMLSNFKELDNIHAENLKTSFEHIIFCYLEEKNEMISFKDWYQRHYPQKKQFDVLMKIFGKFSYRISLQQLNQHYKSFISEQRQFILDILPKGQIKKLLTSRTGILEPDYCNKINCIPKTLECSTITEQNLWTVIMKMDNFSKHDARIVITEMDLNSPSQIDRLSNLIKNEELKNYLNESFFKGHIKLDYIREVIFEPMSLDDAIGYLKQTCCLCCNEFPIPEMCGFIICNHEFCRSCLLEWLKVTITEKYPCNWKCPCCEERTYSEIDKILCYSQFRDMLSNDKFLLNIFNEKLLQEQLSTCSNFHWCSNEQCTNGFEAEGTYKIQCPSCYCYMCVKCNRKWQTEHDDKTCEEFELWLLKNDTDLSKLLSNIGIECPNCGMRYALAPGGCLHFDCKVCGTKFCGGCYRLFVDTCNSPYCQMTSFHSHHPRNCLYYLRDYELNDLEDMLQNFDYPKLQGRQEGLCEFIITNKSFKEERCTANAHGSTGMCIIHYKEYLVQFINRYQIDPADFVDTHSLSMMLFQMTLPSININPDENDFQYHCRLREEVKAKCSFYMPK